PESVVSDAAEKAQVRGRSMLVRRLKPLPIEAVCRGYLIGSGWKDYCATGSVCGITLPAGLRLADKLPQTIFTPATKAEMGEHDENISFAQMSEIIGESLAEQVRDVTLRLYESAAIYAAEKGIIIADTKFEFASENGKLILIDEILTPDSSRFWRAESWKPGQNPESFDKQYMRDWLETTDWNKKAPPPTVPADVIADTTKKYQEIRDLLMSV
ncbi:MAG: phosphoribosylaminoimidazolesuccinocarboxamide synthase, partial [Proteobacteria bacterium]|nr:phosphoribosylaminoimidazolesuccinocarboxamide synthase [Pseudomonadota bacterium]